MEVGNAAAHRELGEAYLQSRRFKEAVEQFQVCIRLSPTDPAAYYSLGRL
jgi:Flp pilus assembly protein TadD